MYCEDDMESIRKAAQRMINILGLKGSPVGVRLLGGGDPPHVGIERLRQHRYCRALMRAWCGVGILSLMGVSLQNESA